jgi:15-cis-phytoene desaturase
MKDPGVIVIGAGLAGLACALDLAERGFNPLVLEARSVVGGRTSSWVEHGMPVESGLHRVLGFYREFPDLLRQAGINIDDIVHWEDEIEIRLPDGCGRAVLGVSPLHRPFKTFMGAVGIFQLLSPFDVASLPGFFAGGFIEYFGNPKALDRWNIADKASGYGVTENAIRRLLVPLTSGLYFLPPERYSAYAFFGTLGPYLARLYSLRVGAFVGGMTEVMASPLADAITRRGGTVRTDCPVRRLLLEGDRVVGVETDRGHLLSSHVVLAASLHAAQRLVGQGLASHPWFQPMLQLPSMPAVTVQMELDCRSMELDRVTFGPGTALASFAEQSRTTFRGLSGRISVILTPAEPFLDMDDRDIMELTCQHAERLGLRLRNHVQQYRVIRLAADFYSLSPGSDALRPPQQTPVPGLTLAGDYTRQQYLATMEGAVVSGRIAARVVRSAFEGSAGR